MFFNLLWLSRIAMIPIGILTTANTMMAQTSQLSDKSVRTFELAAKSNGNLFVGYVVVLIITGLLIACLTVVLRRSDSSLQELVQEDANARISDAGARADNAQAQSELAKKDAANAKKGAAEATERAENANRRAQELENANLVLGAKVESLRQENLVLGIDVAKANASAATAQKEAAEARLALEQYKTPRAIGFDAAKQHRVSDVIKRFAGLKFDVGIATGDSECAFLLGPVETALKNSGLIQVDWTDHTPSAVMFVRDGQPKVGNVAAFGLMIEVDAQKHPEFWDAAQSIEAAFIEAGLPSKAFPDLKTNGANPDAIHILIGKK